MIKNFEEFISESNIEQKAKHKRLLDFEDDQKSDGSELNRVKEVEDTTKDEEDKD